MDVLQALNELAISPTEEVHTELKAKLSHYLNHLLLTDFGTLVQLLYRVDVSENKLKQELADNKAMDAGDILADLLLSRQAEKLKTNQKFNFSSSPDENEKW